MHVSLYAKLSTCIQHICMHAIIQNHACLSTYIHVYIHIYIDVCLHTNISTCIEHICLHALIHTYIHVCLQVYMVSVFFDLHICGIFLFPEIQILEVWKSGNTEIMYVGRQTCMYYHSHHSLYNLTSNTIMYT